MDHFTYRDNELYCEQIPVSAIAREAGTPCYVYSTATLCAHLERLQSAFASLNPQICFSLKSCANLSICRLLVEHGAGMDLVSGGELERALEAGADPAMCVMAGVGKTDDEIRAALREGVGWINVESEAELARLRELALDEGVRPQVALRINPDIDAHTHRYTTTGTRETKFGVDFERAVSIFERHRADDAIDLSGVHVHIGSPVLTVEPYLRTVERVIGLIDAVAERGVTITMLDLGGGFGADYESGQSPAASDYAAALTPLLQSYVDAGLTLVLEPGRSIAANAGILIVRTVYTKVSGARTFVIVDGGMNVLLRPSHYEAFHFIWPTSVRERTHVPSMRCEHPSMDGLERVDVVGPICETGDFLALDRSLPPIERGDLLAVFAAGAYGMVMASRYNASRLPAEVLVDGEDACLVRQRETYDDLIEHERTVTPLALVEDVAP